VRSRWISTPLGLLWVDEDHLVFRSRILWPRPLRLARNEVSRVVLDGSRVRFDLTTATGLRFAFSTRRADVLMDDLRRNGWPIDDR